MKVDCLRIEELELHAASPADCQTRVREHLVRCDACQARLGEVRENLALFSELESSVGPWRLRVIPAAAPPNQIGEFTVIREIGRGGMGVVYEARQAHPERHVAVKLLRNDHGPSDERRRFFEREIRALARLRHPGITAIYGSGTSDAGPYYAMEFVEGVSMAEHTQTLSLEPAVRLPLFLKICSAVTYAHQRGVIHRDIKPGNILVEADGNPKILDFGLARITESDVSCVTLAADRSQLIGTLAYMSPEQARGAAEEIDLRSDVYSLGVVLFELLTGTLPYDVPRTSVAGAVRSICESAPRRPSDVSTAVVRKRRLSTNELDVIVLKALEKSPDRRYQSASALADDIERYLNCRPIIARPTSAIYQFRKFAQRNRALVGALAAVFIAVSLGLVTTWWQAVRARAAEQQAREEAATAREISRFLTSMFKSVDPAIAGPDVRVVDMLKRAATRLDSAFAGQPGVAITLREAIGSAYESLGLYRVAAPQFQSGLTTATTTLGESSREALRLRYHLALATANEGDAGQVLADLRRTYETQSRQFGRNDADTLTTANYLATLNAVKGEYAEAERLYREVVLGRRETLGPEDAKTLETMSSLGILLVSLGQREEGAAFMRQAYETSLRVAGPDDPCTIKFASVVATLARSSEEYEAIEPMYRDLVKRAELVYGPEHELSIGILGSFGQLLELRCKFDEAVVVSREAHERTQKTHGPDDGRTMQTRTTLMQRLNVAGRLEEAEGMAREILATCRERYGLSDSRTLSAMYDLSSVLKWSKDKEAALQLATDALRHHAAATGEHSPDAAVTRVLTADILWRLGRVEPARSSAEQALQDLKAATGVAEALIGWAECTLAACLMDQNQLTEAEPLLRDGYRLIVAAIGECHPTSVEMAQRIAEFERRQGRG